MARSAVLVAVVPALRGVDLAPFWARFRRTAPWHLRLGLWVAVVCVGTVLPRWRGHLRGLGGLSRLDADAVLMWGAERGGWGDLVEILKVVGGLALGEGEAWDDAVRGVR